MASPDQPAATMPPRQPAQGVDSRTIIGKGVTITGEITGTGDVEVRGAVSGAITLKNNVATISKSGVVQASITAKNVEISGRVEGDVVAGELVIIRRDSTVSGNVNAPRISLEDGAHFKGSVDMQSSQHKPSVEVPRHVAQPPGRPAVQPHPAPVPQRPPAIAPNPKR